MQDPMPQICVYKSLGDHKLYALTCLKITTKFQDMSMALQAYTHLSSTNKVHSSFVCVIKCNQINERNHYLLLPSCLIRIKLNNLNNTHANECM